MSQGQRLLCVAMTSCLHLQALQAGQSDILVHVPKRAVQSAPSPGGQCSAFYVDTPDVGGGGGNTKRTICKFWEQVVLLGVV